MKRPSSSSLKKEEAKEEKGGVGKETGVTKTHTCLCSVFRCGVYVVVVVLSVVVSRVVVLSGAVSIICSNYSC